MSVYLLRCLEAEAAGQTRGGGGRATHTRARSQRRRSLTRTVFSTTRYSPTRRAMAPVVAATETVMDHSEDLSGVGAKVLVTEFKIITEGARGNRKISKNYRPKF